jgi:hypothetical protein
MDRPIIFSAPMIRAIRREIAAPGTGKTQTRRILTKLTGFGAVAEFGPSDTRGYDWHFRDRRKLWNDLRDAEMRKCLPYAVGDRLWVRENCQAVEQPSGDDGVQFPADEAWEPIQAGSRGAADDWLMLFHYGNRRGAVVPSIHMPRWASRLTLLVTDVRVERLAEISEADAVAEGLIKLPASGRYVVEKGEQYFGLAQHTARARFSNLWDSLHGEGAFATSPWVVAVSFQPFETNIDRMPERQAAPVPAAAE